MIHINYFAQTYELSNGVCTYDGVVQSSTIPCTDAGVTGVAIPNSVFAVLIIFALVFLGLWSAAFYHAWNHTELASRKRWIVILLASLPLLLFWLSPFIYYFTVIKNQAGDAYFSPGDVSQFNNPYQTNPNPYVDPSQQAYSPPQPADPYQQPVQAQPSQNQQYPPAQPYPQPQQQPYPPADNGYQAPPAPNQTFYPTANPEAESEEQNRF